MKSYGSVEVKYIQTDAIVFSCHMNRLCGLFLFFSSGNDEFGFSRSDARICAPVLNRLATNIRPPVELA